MKLSKQQLLDLIKVLTHYEMLTHRADDYSTPRAIDDVEGLRTTLEDALTGEDVCCDDEDCGEAESDEEEGDDWDNEEEEEDEEAEDDVDEEEEDSSEEDEEDAESEDDSEEDEDLEDDDESDDEEEELVADSYASSRDLHELKPVKTTQGSLEFEEDEDGEECDVLLNTYHECTITHLRRKGKELHVRDKDGEWRTYNVAKYPAGWADLLPLNELVEIEN